MNRSMLVISFVIGAAVGNLLLVQYAARSRWWKTITGRVLFSLFAVIAASYDLSALALLWPDFWRGPGGLTIRVIARFAIDAVLIGMYVLLVRAQRRDRQVPADAESRE